MTVTEETTRDDVIAALGYLNATAKDISRRGYTGTESADYASMHARIDGLLTTLGEMDATG